MLMKYFSSGFLIFFIHNSLFLIFIEYRSEKSLVVILSNWFSNLADKGLNIIRINNPVKKIAAAIGLYISSNEKPMFLREIISLLFIKYL